jgi:hypothetical protein
MDSAITTDVGFIAGKTSNSFLAITAITRSKEVISFLFTSFTLPFFVRVFSFS